jgi:hypothetical protein
MASTFKALRQRADLQLCRVELADGEQPPACDLLSARSETHVALGGAGGSLRCWAISVWVSASG